jgi:spermidine synthase
MPYTQPSGVQCRCLEIPTELQARQIIALYRHQGWWEAADDERHDLLNRLIRGSHCFVLAEEGEVVLGMGRAISDGVSDAYIQDLAVLYSRRRQGIGRLILQKLLARLRGDGIAWIGLIAEPGSENLYRHASFQAMIGATPMRVVEE